jgi:hypothetical protein
VRRVLSPRENILRLPARPVSVQESQAPRESLRGSPDSPEPGGIFLVRQTNRADKDCLHSAGNPRIIKALKKNVYPSSGPLAVITG